MTVYYGSSVASSTVTTACLMTTTTGGAETNKANSVSGGGVYCEVYSQGGSQTAVSAIGSPSGHGWLTTAPGSGTFAAGNWSASIALALGASATVTFTVRFYKYSSGTYTSIGTIASSSTSLGTTRTVVSFSAKSMSSVTFAAGDLLYCDLWMNDSTGTGGDNPVVYESTSSTAGVANDVQITTSTFTVSSVTKYVGARTRLSVLKTLVVGARTRLSVLSTETAGVRTLLRVLKTISAGIRTRLSILITKTVGARTRLRVLRTVVIGVRTVLQASVTKTIGARTRLRVLKTVIVGVRAVIHVFATKTLGSRARISVLVTKSAGVRALLRVLRTRTVGVRAIIHAFATKTLGSRVRLRVLVSKTTGVRTVLFASFVKTVGVRVRLAGIASGKFGVWANGTGTATYQYFRATQYPDPALSLAPVIPRLGTSLVSWDANTTTLATLGVDLSTDGVNWTDVSLLGGQAFPMYYNQPDPTIDGFQTDSSANYTSTARTGGTTATWAWDTTNSRLIATGGTNAILYNSQLSRADVDFFADLDQSDAGGMVWRFVDVNNFYYLLIGDTLTSSGTKNTITLYRVASNVQTQLATAPITYTYGTGTGATTGLFWRGTYHRFRVTMLGSAITVLVDGNQLISYTDGSPISSAGHVGLYNNGGTTGSRYYQFWIQPQGDYVTGTPSGDIVTGQFVYTRQRLATTDPTTSPQVLDMTTLAAGPNIRSGVQIASITYDAAYIGKTYDDLAKTSNYSWYIGVDASGNKTIYFRPSSANPAPWILQSTPTGIASDLEHDSNLIVEAADNTLYRNRQTLKGVVATGTFTDPFVGDGKATSFTLRYKIASGFTPTITLNNISQTVGLKGTTGSQWYYAVGDATIAQDSSGTALQTTDALVVAYTGTYTTNLTVDNTAAQTALAAIQGGSGIVEEVEDVSSQLLNVAAATTYAQQLLARYCIPGGRTLTIKTYRNGLDILQTLTAFFKEMNVIDAQLLLTEIDITMQTQYGGNVLYAYLLTCSELPYIASWSVLLGTNLLT